MSEAAGKGEGLRITTWNVNGIRNPFGYQPWRQERTFAAMFEILEADIVVMQETKIQRKDLKDDMVLVPGWDVFFSLPKHKKGYSGVAIYTRNSVCAPIRAEEGITGILTAPNSTTSFSDLPKDQQIGGYPTPYQLSGCSLDAATLDSEGRCVILEFPAFVLIGTYCPATRDESRDEFRIGFLDALDARVRNLVSRGKRVFLTGDLNIMRAEIDTANVDEMLKKRGMSAEEFFSMPSRKMLNQLLIDGKVYGEREEGREEPVMWDLCRAFHPTRKGMFTCWEQKINARPGNFGSRIDYVLCSQDWKDWFLDSNIQEGLMGSDHCPVYATLKQRVQIKGEEVDIRDIMSSEMFKNGVRQRDWSAKDLLPTSAKLIPEFDRRRNIRDMFSRKQSIPSQISQKELLGDESESQAEASVVTRESSVSLRESIASLDAGSEIDAYNPRAVDVTQSKGDAFTGVNLAPEEEDLKYTSPPSNIPTKRPANTTATSSVPPKRGKANPKAAKGQPVKSQRSLMGFFKPKATAPVATLAAEDPNTVSNTANDTSTIPTSSLLLDDATTPAKKEEAEEKPFVDPFVAKEGWSKLLAKRVVPRCEHNEPCVSLVTKKAGVNCGRSFFMCPRPLGPSGAKEKNTQWRCGTFIWSSDWTNEGT